MFFDQFRFSISFRPGSKNTKADALSRQYSPDEEHLEPAPVLPASCRVGFLSWSVEETIQQALQTEPDPGTGHFIPAAARSAVIRWAHASRFSCHPGTGRTISLLKRHFWWRTLERDVKEYVAACEICARSKTRTQRPSGLLQPLAIPSRPWTS